MNKKLFIAFFAIHGGLGLSAFVLLNGFALAAADAGRTAPAVAWLDLLLHALLLQPFAHWMLEALPLHWWTWPGLAGTTLVIGLNSVVVAALVTASWRRLRGSRGPA